MPFYYYYCVLPVRVLYIRPYLLYLGTLRAESAARAAARISIYLALARAKEPPILRCVCRMERTTDDHVLVLALIQRE